VDGAATARIARLNGDPARHFTSISLFPGGTVRLPLEGAGYRQTVESSTDPFDWVPVFSQDASSNRIEFTDGGSGQAKRFYRVRRD
jgi:hypothetical protein